MSSRLQRARVRPWTLADSYCFIASFFARQHHSASDPFPSAHPQRPQQHHHHHHQHGHGLSSTSNRRHFHDYFVTHLPSSSLHPDSRAPSGLHHKLPRSASTPHTPAGTRGGPSPATVQAGPVGISRETTVVRIPLRSAKHHFGASVARGTRRATEDAYQAGVIDLPAFAKRAPLSITIGPRSAAAAAAREGRDVTGPPPTTPEQRGAETASGDPQVFYFGVFDGHGGQECSEFLKEKLHEYIQDASTSFELQSSLRERVRRKYSAGWETEFQPPQSTSLYEGNNNNEVEQDGLPILQGANRVNIGKLEKELVTDWKDLVGGYFRRFRPTHFSFYGESIPENNISASSSPQSPVDDTELGVTIEEVLEYAFLKADFDFVSAQAEKKDDDEKPLNESDILHSPSLSRRPMIGGPKRFKGGSTCSVTMISTPTPTPFWHPSTPSSMLVSHVGDTRILLCSTATGIAIPLTTDHHPSSPVEGNRLRRYAATFVTDSFGEERMSGLANTRAFGDIHSKRMGVSAEPEIRRIEMGPAEFSFLVLMSDGVSGTLTDQEVVDIVKEARTPDQGAADVVSFATEVSTDGDNATCLVVRLGGWERRLEGGLGSMGTKETRDWRRQEATVPRSRRS